MDSDTTDTQSSTNGLTRKEFIKTVLERSAAAGVLAVAANAFSVFRPAPNLAAKGASLGPTGSTGITGITGPTG